jgi:hypothetical protein
VGIEHVDIVNKVARSPWQRTMWRFPVTKSACIISPLRRQPDGVCHRCGWSGPVCPIPLKGLRYLKSAVAFGRICDECAEDLFSNPCPSRPSAGRACTQPTARQPSIPRATVQRLSLVV